MLLFLGLTTFSTVKAQSAGKEKSLLSTENSTDTLKSSEYINQGKIAGKKAINRSLILPGLGQIYNYGLISDDIKSGRVQGKKIGQKMAIVGKVAGIYVAGFMLVNSYIDNNQKYRMVLKELQYRQLNDDKPDPNGELQDYPNTQSLYTAKATYKNNREVVLISIAAVYGINVIDAYVTARLKYINVDENLAFKVTPSIINSGTVYSSNSYIPALKLSLKL